MTDRVHLTGKIVQIHRNVHVRLVPQVLVYPVGITEHDLLFLWNSNAFPGFQLLVDPILQNQIANRFVRMPLSGGRLQKGIRSPFASSESMVAQT